MFSFPSSYSSYTTEIIDAQMDPRSNVKLSEEQKEPEKDPSTSQVNKFFIQV